MGSAEARRGRRSRPPRVREPSAAEVRTAQAEAAAAAAASSGGGGGLPLPAIAGAVIAGIAALFGVSRMNQVRFEPSY